MHILMRVQSIVKRLYKLMWYRKARKNQSYVRKRVRTMYNRQKTWVRVMAIILAGMMVVGILAGALYSIF